MTIGYRACHERAGHTEGSDFIEASIAAELLLRRHFDRYNKDLSEIGLGKLKRAAEKIQRSVEEYFDSGLRESHTCPDCAPHVTCGCRKCVNERIQEVQDIVEHYVAHARFIAPQPPQLDFGPTTNNHPDGYGHGV